MQAINFLNLQKNPYFYKKKAKEQIRITIELDRANFLSYYQVLRVNGPKFCIFERLEIQDNFGLKAY